MRIALRHLELAAVAIWSIAVLVQKLICDPKLTAHMLDGSTQRNLDLCTRIWPGWHAALNYLLRRVALVVAIFLRQLLRQVACNSRMR